MIKYYDEPKAENFRLKQRLQAREAQDERYHLIGYGGNMLQVYDIINKIADIRCNVIIEGETGTGGSRHSFSKSVRRIGSSMTLFNI